MVGGPVWCRQSLMACMASFLCLIWSSLIRNSKTTPACISFYYEKLSVMHHALGFKRLLECIVCVRNRIKMCCYWKCRMKMYYIYSGLGRFLMSNINKYLWVLQEMKEVPQIHLLKIYKLFCTWHGVCQSLPAAAGSALGDAGWICNVTWLIHGVGSKSSY